MISDRLKTRLQKNRPMISTTVRIPKNVVESLKRIAPHKGFARYQALLKAYVGQGLQYDEALHVFGPAAGL